MRKKAPPHPSESSRSGRNTQIRFSLLSPGQVEARRQSPQFSDIYGARTLNTNKSAKMPSCLPWARSRTRGRPSTPAAQSRDGREPFVLHLRKAEIPQWQIRDTPAPCNTPPPRQGTFAPERLAVPGRKTPAGPSPGGRGNWSPSQGLGCPRRLPPAKFPPGSLSAGEERRVAGGKEGSGPLCLPRAAALSRPFCPSPGSRTGPHSAMPRLRARHGETPGPASRGGAPAAPPRAGEPAPPASSLGVSALRRQLLPRRGGRTRGAALPLLPCQGSRSPQPPPARDAAPTPAQLAPAPAGDGPWPPIPSPRARGCSAQLRPPGSSSAGRAPGRLPARRFELDTGGEAPPLGESNCQSKALLASRKGPGFQEASDSGGAQSPGRLAAGGGLAAGVALGGQRSPPGPGAAKCPPSTAPPPRCLRAQPRSPPGRSAASPAGRPGTPRSPPSPLGATFACGVLLAASPRPWQRRRPPIG